jgi:hypothetical protein
VCPRKNSVPPGNRLETRSSNPKPFTLLTELSRPTHDFKYKLDNFQCSLKRVLLLPPSFQFPHWVNCPQADFGDLQSESGRKLLLVALVARIRTISSSSGLDSEIVHHNLHRVITATLHYGGFRLNLVWEVYKVKGKVVPVLQLSTTP